MAEFTPVSLYTYSNLIVRQSFVHQNRLAADRPRPNTGYDKSDKNYPS